MSAETDMLKARAQLLMDEPFFGTLALKLKLYPNNDECKTAATDGARLIYNTDFIQKLTPLTRKGLIAHEVMHCVFNHMTRRNHRDPKLWNVATDYAINLHLKDSGFFLPDGGLLSEDYRDMTADHIYNLIKDDNPKECSWGQVLDAGTGQVQGGSDAAMESEWQVAVNQAAKVAQDAGKLPAHIETFIKDIVKPLVDWRSVLWPFCTTLITDDYSWRRPNRAYISEDEYFPSMHIEGAGHLAVIVDTSGSCNGYLDQFFTEMAAIHSDLTPEKITIVHCDAQVAFTEEIDQYDEFPIATLHGGGGTRFSPAFTWLIENAPDVEAAVYLTDLESSDFGATPPFPVLWVSTDPHGTAPFGQICTIQLEPSY